MEFEFDVQSACECNANGYGYITKDDYILEKVKFPSFLLVVKAEMSKASAKIQK